MIFFKRFLKREKANTVQNGAVNGFHEFDYVMDFVKVVMKKETQKENKLIILDFILEVIKEDLKSDLLSTIFYSKEHFEKEMKLPFPLYFYDEFDQKHDSLPLEENRFKKVDLAKDCVLVLPWHGERMMDRIKNLFTREFEFDESNHKAYYFSPVDICYVYNGNHSIASGVVYKKGHIIAKEWDVSRLFVHEYTDGLNWYNSHKKGQIIDTLFDFRIGIIFEISKLKFEIQ